MKRRLYLYGSLILIIGLLVFAIVNPVFYVPKVDQTNSARADQYNLRHHVEILSAHGTPGADDNASGTAGLIELARMLAPKNDQLKRPVILVAYTLEEPPNFRTKDMGSFVHAQLMVEQGRSVKLMISLEMIGYFKDESGTQNYPVPGLNLIYPSKGNYISIVARPEEWMITRDIKSLFMSATDLPLYSANIPAKVPGVDYSDHASYWQLGFPAVMITDTAFMRNPNYHEKTDLPSTLDYRRMSEVINGVYAIAVGL